MQATTDIGKLAYQREIGQSPAGVRGLGFTLMANIPPIANFGLLLGLSFFLGLAFEDFFAKADTRRPGGVRTFPILSLAGGTLYLFDPTHLVPFTAGLLVVGIWLAVFYNRHICEPDEAGESSVGLVILLLNFLAYVLGAVALGLPNWIAVGTTVAAVLLLTGREQLHDLARRVEIKEIVTAGQFLILTGLILPLLPAHPISSLTSITPRQAWLALVAVCTVSYASYIAQRYWAASIGGLWMAALGGLYSSTATTVVLARQAKFDEAIRAQAQAGITLATAIMYLRILLVVAVFNTALARRLAIPLLILCIAALLIVAAQWWLLQPSHQEPKQIAMNRNPLELGTAAIFSVLFVVTSLLSTWVTAEFGTTGVYWLAAIVGFTDIDPFVLNLAEGGTAAVPMDAIVVAIVIATSSNNVLKAGYAAFFSGGRAVLPSVIALLALAAAGGVFAIAMASLGGNTG